MISNLLSLLVSHLASLSLHACSGLVVLLLGLLAMNSVLRCVACTWLGVYKHRYPEVNVGRLIEGIPGVYTAPWPSRDTRVSRTLTSCLCITCIGTTLLLWLQSYMYVAQHLELASSYLPAGLAPKLDVSGRPHRPYFSRCVCPLAQGLTSLAPYANAASPPYCLFTIASLCLVLVNGS